MLRLFSRLTKLFFEGTRRTTMEAFLGTTSSSSAYTVARVGKARIAEKLEVAERSARRRMQK
jgi:hypothetical protein